MKQADKTWKTVYVTGHDYEASLVASRLKSEGIDAVVMTKRDSAFSLNVGDLSQIFVLVPPLDAHQAETILAQRPFSDNELGDIAEAASPFVGEDSVVRPDEDPPDETDED